MSYDALRGLKAEDFQHPGEKIAMAAMHSIPLLGVVLAHTMDVSIQTGMYAEACGNYFRITEKTCPRVYRLYKLALQRLDIQDEFPLFSMLSYDYNGYTTGIKKPHIVLCSSVISNYSDEELLYIIGHELGHVKCGHLLYHNMAAQLNSILSSMGGIATATAIALQYAIMDWGRKSEYSADRAGMIAAGGVEGAYNGTLKMLGPTPYIPDIDISVDKVLQQLSEFEEQTETAYGKLLYISYTAERTHPWTILRLKQIKDWYESGEYNAVISKFTTEPI